MPNSSFMTAWVEIKADLQKIRADMEEVKKIFKDSATEAEKSWKKSADGMAGSFDSLASFAKKALMGVGIYEAIKKISHEAMLGQDTIFLLGSSLKIIGGYTKETMQDFIDFANTIQEVTTHSNDEVLAMMRLQHWEGVSAEKMKLAAIWAIGLADALNIGIEASARYVALGLQGETRMLSRYIPALKTVATEQEKLTIIGNIASKAFEFSGAKTDIASGSLKQMKNVLQDVVQAMGAGFLPIISETSKQIKAWAEQNTNNIAYWANMFFAYVGYVKDVIIDLVSFMRKDFNKGFDTSFKIILELTKGFGESLSIILGAAALKAGNFFVQSLLAPITKGLSNFFNREWGIGGFSGRPFAGIAEAIKKWEPEPFNVIPIGPELELQTKTTADNIRKIAEQSGVDITEANDKLKNRLVQIKIDQSKQIIDIETNTVSKAKELVAKLSNVNMLPEKTREAREAEESLKIKIIDMTVELDLQKNIANVWGKTREITEMQALAVKASAGNTAELEEHMKKINKLAAEQQLIQRWKDFGSAIESSLNSAFEKAIFQGQKFKDTMLEIGNAIVQEFIKLQFIKPFVGMMSGWLSSIGQSIFPGVATPMAHGGGEVGNLPNTRMVSPSVFSGAKKYHGLQQGEQAIIAKDGEVISNGQPAMNITIHLNAIDAQSGLQFLTKNQNVITGLFQKSLGENSPARRRR